MNQQEQIIDLTYMKAISLGDQAYEKEVTRQFIELIPEHLAILQTYFESGAYEQVRKEVHRMVATIFIMGLNLKLEREVEAIVNHNLSKAEFAAYLEIIIKVCNRAKLEAEALLLTF